LNQLWNQLLLKLLRNQLWEMLRKLKKLNKYLLLLTEKTGREAGFYFK
jgi:hypothetical protein